MGETEGAMDSVGERVGVADGLGLGTEEYVGNAVGGGVVGTVGTAFWILSANSMMLLKSWRSSPKVLLLLSSASMLCESTQKKANTRERTFIVDGK